MKLIKNNKWKLIISSIVIILPTLIGIFGAKALPEKIAVHWGFSGEVDGFMSPMSAFFIIPAILLGIHWLCWILTALIEKNNEQNKKMYEIMFWIMPVMSLFCSGMILASALGHTSNIFAYVMLLLAVMFIVIGNYMPKTTRNRTMGIKIKWTLANDENWNATHRFAGKVYVAIGFLCLLAIPLPEKAFPLVMIGFIIACSLVPLLYSYIFYRKQLASGSVSKEEMKKEYAKMFGNSKAAIAVTAIIVVIIFVLVAFLMFTGDIKAVCTDDSFDVKASFSEDFSVKYEDIDSVEYREGGVDGQRIYGFASARLLMGSFKNKEFGNYTRYTYAKDLPCIVLKIDERVVVIGTDNAEATKEIYDTLTSKISK